MWWHESWLVACMVYALVAVWLWRNKLVSRRQKQLALFTAAAVPYFLWPSLFTDPLVSPGLLFSVPKQPSRNAIFGFYDGIPASRLARFLSSLRGSGSTADVYIVCQLQSVAQYQAVLDEYQATAVGYEAGILVRTGIYQFSSLRFRIYNRILQRLKAAKISYTSIMTADISDVTFQLDPFSILSVFEANRSPPPSGEPSEVILAAYENENNIISRTDITGKWIAGCFGNLPLASITGRRVSCSGSTVGTAAAMERYIQLMDSLSTRNLWCSVQGADQGVHNYILHSAAVLGKPLLPMMQAVSLETGPILTLDRVPQLLFDEPTGLVLNAIGRPYYMIHQIRRCPTAERSAQPYVAGEASKADRLSTVVAPQALRDPSHRVGTMEEWTRPRSARFKESAAVRTGDGGAGLRGATPQLGDERPGRPAAVADAEPSVWNCAVLEDPTLMIVVEE